MTGTAYADMATVQLSIANTEREVGITYRRLDWWVRLGYLHPLHLGGSGCPREWTRAELRVARTMGRLVKAGLKPEAAAAVARSGEDRYEIAAGIWIEVAA